MKPRHMVTACLLGSAVAALVGCSSGGDELTYEVTGKVPQVSMISYSADRDIAQESNVRLPWSKTVEVAKGVSGANIRVQNSVNGSITCTIKKDGKVLDTRTTNGEFSIASCTVK